MAMNVGLSLSPKNIETINFKHRDKKLFLLKDQFFLPFNCHAV